MQDLRKDSRLFATHSFTKYILQCRPPLRGDFTTAVVYVWPISKLYFFFSFFPLQARNLWAPVDFPKTSPQVIGRNSASVQTTRSRYLDRQLRLDPTTHSRFTLSFTTLPPVCSKKRGASVTQGVLGMEGPSPPPQTLAAIYFHPFRPIRWWGRIIPSILFVLAPRIFRPSYGHKVYQNRALERIFLKIGHLN